MVMEKPSPLLVGREFVRQYYTLLNKAPDFLHRWGRHVMVVDTRCVCVWSKLTVILCQVGSMEGIRLTFMEVLIQVEIWLKQCTGKRYVQEHY